MNVMQIVLSERPPVLHHLTHCVIFTVRLHDKRYFFGGDWSHFKL